jgi:hypothetical protein
MQLKCLNCKLTDQLSHEVEAFFEKLLVAYLGKKFPAFY